MSRKNPVPLVTISPDDEEDAGDRGDLEQMAPCMFPLLHYSFFLSLHLSLLHSRVCVVFSNIHISDPGNQMTKQTEVPF